MKTKRKTILWILLPLAGIALALLLVLLPREKTQIQFTDPASTPPATPAPTQPLTPEEKLEAFARSHSLALENWPEELVELLEKNPETEDFVLNYPLMKDARPVIDLGECVFNEEVPLLMQWDTRWGYTDYGGSPMGLSGCGPTCLSMVCIYVLQDTRFDPRYVAEFSKENGYCVAGNGSAWTLISQGGEQLGLDVTEIPLDKNRVLRNLEVGNPIIMIMGPGDFTTSGHFIVVTGCEDGKLKVNDPNSLANSEKLWEFEDIQTQIRNLWVCRKK